MYFIELFLGVWCELLGIPLVEQRNIGLDWYCSKVHTLHSWTR